MRKIDSDDKIFIENPAMTKVTPAREFILLSFKFKPVLVGFLSCTIATRKPKTESKTSSEDVEPTDGQVFIGIKGIRLERGKPIHFCSMMRIKRWLKDFEDMDTILEFRVRYYSF